MVYHLLISTQKDDPNPECARAESTNYDAALATLLEQNLAGMMEMLFAIQRFCNEIGFPKVGTEGLIQAMFRSVYKFDLVNEDAFSKWKDDESPSVRLESKRQLFKPWASLTGWKKTMKKVKKKKNMKSRKGIQEEDNV